MISRKNNLLFSKNEKWTTEEFNSIAIRLEEYGCLRIKERKEYYLFKEVKNLSDFANVCHESQQENISKSNDDNDASLFKDKLEVKLVHNIADEIPSLNKLHSTKRSLNIGFDTYFQKLKDGNGKDTDYRYVLSLQMSIVIEDKLIRYFFLVEPNYQLVSANGGMIPLRHCLADILNDLKNNYISELPLVRKEKLITQYVTKAENEEPIKVPCYAKMLSDVIPITFICDSGCRDITVFSRKQKDIDIFHNLSSIQGGYMTTSDIFDKLANDKDYNYYWLVNLSFRDLQGLAPDENSSLAKLGNAIGMTVKCLPENAANNMVLYAKKNTIDFYECAVNNSDMQSF